MRRAAIAFLPALAQTYGIRPWEIELLTPGELAVFQRLLLQQNA